MTKRIFQLDNGTMLQFDSSADPQPIRIKLMADVTYIGADVEYEDDAGNRVNAKIIGELELPG